MPALQHVTQCQMIQHGAACTIRGGPPCKTFSRGKQCNKLEDLKIRGPTDFSRHFILLNSGLFKASDFVILSLVISLYSRTSLLRTPFTTFSPIQRTNSKVPNFRNALYIVPVSFTAYNVTFDTTSKFHVKI